MQAGDGRVFPMRTFVAIFGAFAELRCVVAQVALALVGKMGVWAAVPES
jgi:hypothetical protein